MFFAGVFKAWVLRCWENIVEICEKKMLGSKSQFSQSFWIIFMGKLHFLMTKHVKGPQCIDQCFTSVVFNPGPTTALHSLYVSFIWHTHFSSAADENVMMQIFLGVKTHIRHMQKIWGGSNVNHVSYINFKFNQLIMFNDSDISQWPFALTFTAKITDFIKKASHKKTHKEYFCCYF